MRWGVRPEPAEDELLSSYLVRCAGLHGMSAHRFCAFHFPRFEIWTRDIDRSAPKEFVNALASSTGIPLESVRRMTLQDPERLVSSRRRRGTAAWINALGVYHRTRRRHGLQFCPQCLATSSVYKRAWRLSFVVGCEVHGSMLHDACPHCDAPIMPHRQLAGTLRCHRCHRLLAGALLPVAALPRAAAAQQTVCSHAMDTGFADIDGRRIAAHAYFRGLHVLASQAADRGCAFEGPWNIADRVAAPVECARTTQRTALLDSLATLLATWPESFRHYATDMRWTQRTFHRMSIPSWLYREVERLPSGHPRQPGSVRSLRARLAALGKRKPEGWRTVRATFLVDAARDYLS